MAKTKKRPTTPKKNSRRKPAVAKESPSTSKTTTACPACKKPSGATGDRTRKTAAKQCTAGEAEVTVDRRRSDRRTKSEPVAVERRKLERREKVTRRRQIDPTTCERDYSDDEVEFMSALDNYKRASGRMFPTCSEILEVIRKLGYSKLPETEDPATEHSEAADRETIGTNIPVWTSQSDDDSMSGNAFASSESLV